tara:strand:+ start:962 stop:1666 length:705 start_codon:yes stop_codon:yes gene_type:complete
MCEMYCCCEEKLTTAVANTIPLQGHTFRPDYLNLGQLRTTLPNTRVLCFSATCNAFVRNCLDRCLALRAPTLFEHDAGAPRKPVTITLHMRRKRAACLCGNAGCGWVHGSDASVLQAVQGHSHGGVLLFTAARASCDKFCAELVKGGMVADVYHGGLEDDVRSEVQARFLRKEIGVLVCTMASFGTGVDMPGVRKVSLEHFLWHAFGWHFFVACFWFGFCVKNLHNCCTDVVSE